MAASRTWVLVAMTILLAGCAGGGEDESDAAGTTSASPASTPAVAETAPSVPSPTDPEGGIPADLLLPGQADGTVEPRTGAGRLYDYICLDPEQQWTLGGGFVEAQTVIIPSPDRDGASIIEKLAAYSSEPQATEAVRGLRAQVDLCGDGPDHAGTPTTWRAAGLTAPAGADEAVQFTYRSGGTVSAVVTVARVGRAVFYIDRREQHASGVPSDERTVAAFVPTLAKAFR